MRMMTSGSPCATNTSPRCPSECPYGLPHSTWPHGLVPSVLMAVSSSRPQGGDPVPEGVLIKQEDEHRR